jgi:hypothetical protein
LTVFSKPASIAGEIRRAAAWSATVVFVTAVYFQTTGPGWNIKSRFNLTLALAERGTFRIDEYQNTDWIATNDKAVVDGHFYSDKTPVTSFAGTPLVWMYRQLNLRFGVPFRYEYALWMVTWFVVGGSAAALAAMLTTLLAHRGLSPLQSAAAAVLWIAATPLLGYSTLFYDYLPACALITGAFLAAQDVWRGGTPSAWRMLGAGILAGLSCWTLNTSAITAVTVTLLIAVGGVGRSQLTAIGARLAPWAAGGMIGAAGFFIYNYAIFGSPYPGYVFEYDPFFREQMAQGLMGAKWPRPLVVWLQTIHPYQGLFLWFPVTALAVLGCLWTSAREPGPARRESLTVLVTFVLFVLYSSGYYMWWGGYSGYAPRHVIPGLPLLAIGLIPWIRSYSVVKGLLWTFAGAASLFNLTCAAVNPQFPPLLDLNALLRPERVRVWPTPILRMQYVFWSQDSVEWNSDVNQWNLGRQLGLEGPPSLIPLVGIWIIAFVLLPRWLHRTRT